MPELRPFAWANGERRASRCDGGREVPRWTLRSRRAKRNCLILVSVSGRALRNEAQPRPLLGAGHPIAPQAVPGSSAPQGGPAGLFYSLSRQC